jgi:photosystem II stability/assembly factor-like uncharacterized protein
MKLPIALAFVLLACSSAPEVPDAAADAGDEPTVDALDPNTPYEHAVMDAQWQKLATGPSVSGGQKQDDVFFVDPMLGFVASGPTWSIWKTTDGGGSWTKVFTQQGTYFRAVLFLDAMHGFAGNIGAGLSSQITDTNVLYETLDGGNTWNPVTNITGPTPSGVCNLTAVDATHLFAVGRANGPSNVLVSSDAGASWTSIDVSSKFAMLVDAHFTSPTDGVLVGMNQNAVCSIMVTHDGAQTLTPVFASKVPNSLCWKVSFPSDQVGYVAIQDATVGPPTFAKTIDGGNTWTEMPLPTQATKTSPYPAIGIGFITDNVGWVSPEDASMPTYRTTDGGNTWTVDATLKSPINRFRFVDQNTAYAVGGSVWKLSITWP